MRTRRRKAWRRRIHERTVMSYAAARKFLFTSSLALAAWLPVRAATIDVLWYTYADPASEYRSSGVPGLAARSASDPQSSGLNWNVTFWEPTGPTPDFKAYDVLFVETGEAFRTGAPGAPLATPDYSGILNNRAAITAARGDRTFVDGADAEFHAIRGDSGNCPAFSGCALWDGAVGHVVNGVNWAGSGHGLGIFASLDGEFPGSFWWNDARSFLHDELDGAVSYHHSDNSPVISATASSYPLNHGLTSLGLSNWHNSFHAYFDRSLVGPTGYSEVVGSSVAGFSVAIASTDWISAPTAPLAVPEPATWAMLLAGLAAVATAARRQGAG